MRSAPIALAIATLGFVMWFNAVPSHAEQAVTIPAPKLDVIADSKLEVAIFAGGCFWGIEAVFESLKGVQSATSGYAGGTAATANYEAITSERTGHAEAVKIVYDPKVISYGTLLRIFFSAAHDPTQLNRQGPDVGPSYRSAIFTQSPQQLRVARAYIAQLNQARVFTKPIVTRLEGGNFFAAETYHQDFARKNPRHPYIVQWDLPKIRSVRAAFPRLVR